MSGSVKHLSFEEQQVYREKHGHVAPEIIAGQSPPTVASDIFSFGRLVGFIARKLRNGALKVVGKTCTHSDPKSRPTFCVVIQQLIVIKDMLLLEIAHESTELLSSDGTSVVSKWQDGTSCLLVLLWCYWVANPRAND